MLKFDLEQNCYGCGACASICPKHAIEMKPNFEGFLMPYIYEDKCVKCGICKKKCAFLNPTKASQLLIEAMCKAAYRIDDNERMKSASGGVAAVIAEVFLSKGGVVVGCGWTDTLVARHMATHTQEEVCQLRGSKYVQSDLTDSYKEVKAALDERKSVLFIGTPCQVGAMRNVFGNPNGLYLFGLICGGVPSPKVWSKFKQEKEVQYNSKMIRANFRSKGRYGWNTPVALYEFENGKKSQKLSFQLDDYVLQYLYGVFKRNSCYQCNYKGDGINADMILGDYWGSPEFRDRSGNRGVSAILCLTQKGEECTAMLENRCEVIDTDLESILHRNQPLIQSVGRGGIRKGFFEVLDGEGYSAAVKKYGGRTNPFKYRGMFFLDKTGLFEVVKRWIKG